MSSPFAHYSELCQTAKEIAQKARGASRSVIAVSQKDLVTISKGLK
jgi:hypothetical protein